MKIFYIVTHFLFLFLLQYLLDFVSGDVSYAWGVIATVATIASAGYSAYNQYQAGRAAGRAGRLQAQQALDNAARQAEDARRRAEEIAYQNMLQIADLQAQSQQLQYESLYQQERGLLGLEDMMADFDAQIKFIDFDIKRIGLTTDYQVSQALASAEIYSVRAGVSAQAAGILREIGDNILEELGLNRILNELSIFDLKQDAASAIEDVDYQIGSIRYDAKLNDYKAKVNSSNAITALQKTVDESDILRRKNSRTIGALKAKLVSRSGSYTGSAKDLVKDQIRESREEIELKYLSGRIEANSYAIASKLNHYTSELARREEAFLSNKKKRIAEDTLRTEEIQRTQFSITELGFENRLLQNRQSIAEAEAASAVYSIQAGMSLATADYLQKLGLHNIAEAEYKQSVLRGESDRQYNLAILELEHGQQLANYNLSRIATTITNLNNATDRAREEAEWLASQYLAAGRRGYNLALSQSESMQYGYYAGALGSISQGLQAFASWNNNRSSNTNTRQGTTLGSSSGNSTAPWNIDWDTWEQNMISGTAGNPFG